MKNNIENKTRAQIPERCRVGFQRYTVVKGDTLEKIAKRFNVTVGFLIVENPHIKDPNKIFPGDVLCVPIQPPPGVGRVPESCPIGYEKYTIKPGDTFSMIAQNIGVPVDLLIWNNPHIPDPNIIFPGDVLCVPVPLKLPSCSILKPINSSLQNTFGSALVQKLQNGQHQLIITGVNLPKPSSLGNYNGYDGFVGIAGIGGYGFPLTNVSSEEGLWIGSLVIFPILSSGNQIYIIPSNSEVSVPSKPLLEGILK
ncbi:LysM peptidoglycan-binding domain-containing protein [Thermobrachium celere]|uniref:LysM peptidoglycan-binding domain-containing protein n=1 Tax=Thermobrachium celere TaxID=53422 RepID=UPI001A3B0AC2|nr:LysM peptidoglycan-binding domain-containing protein [Thermobrachium celere]GFR35454.1 hypothetical protein TCEA9_12660 [Thermobrachium celere]